MLAMESCAGASMELPKYRSHKQVWALKIKEIGAPYADGSAWLTPEDGRYARFAVDGAYMSKHVPHVGGYYVQYEDGYRSFSPAKAFEDGYTAL
jgi:hypothetical protein